MTDYQACNRKFRAQKSALTRAVNTRDASTIRKAVLKAVREWDESPFDGMWPDDWARWQRAINDTERFPGPFTDLRAMRYLV